MDIPSLIILLQNKVNILSNAKSLAFSSGDLDRMNAIDSDLLSTQNTLAQLTMLQAATAAAAQSNVDLSDVVTAGVQAAQNAMTIPDNPTAVLSQYDLSTYASDPLYVQKISDMLMSIPVLDNASEVDAYIASQIVGSPITGAMVINATTTYSVDTRLTVAIMELDSRLGTAGVGAQTYNPGNVGNTGTSTQTYASWSDGVAAVAAWLAQHVVVTAPTPVPSQPVAAGTTTDAATSTVSSTSSDASSTSPVATSTVPTAAYVPPAPVVPPPPVPAIVATSTPIMIGGVATSTAGTTTPVTTGTTTAATSTPTAGTGNSGTATTTDDTDAPATSTDSTDSIDSTSSTTPSTTGTATSTASEATSTPQIPAFDDGDDASTTTSTSTGFVSPSAAQASSTSDQGTDNTDSTASTTQARRMTRRIRV